MTLNHVLTDQARSTGQARSAANAVMELRALKAAHAFLLLQRDALLRLRRNEYAQRPEKLHRRRTSGEERACAHGTPSGVDCALCDAHLADEALAEYEERRGEG